MKTYMANARTVERKWYVVDAEGVPLGRLASKVAGILRGKNKPSYTPNVDTGDFVIIINSDKVVLTGKKAEQKMHRYHTKRRATSWFMKPLRECFPRTRSADR